ncbi:MAG: hypothetical protein ACLQJR_05650 [Stellaceae bacterium]
MMRPVDASRLAATALALAVTGLLPAFAQEDFSFMPKGGKTLLLGVFGASPDPATLAEMTAAGRSEADWNEMVTTRKTGLSDKAIRTLAAYLALNMPLPPAALDAAAKAGDIATVLPPDGRELAWNNCQSCHSLFTGYLTQDRDLQGWQNLFQAPFHRQLKMSAKEREEFSHYAVINMPMKMEDVPEALRF